MPDDDTNLVLVVRATINLPGVPRGTVVAVDPEVPYIRICLERLYLVPLAPDEA